MGPEQAHSYGRQKTPRSGEMAGMRFTSEETLLEWLTQNPKGRAVVMEALLMNSQFVELLRERHLPTHCVVEYLASGPTINVYGPRSLRVRVVEQPLCSTSEEEIRAEADVMKGLPHPFLEQYWPANKRAVACPWHETVHGRARRVEEIEFNLAVIKALNETIHA
jgi:hypothetical protein